MIGSRSGHGRGGFDDIESVHIRTIGRHLASVSEIAGVTKTSRSVRYEIRIERKNHICLFQLINWQNIRTKRLASRISRGVAIDRFVLMPLSFWHLFQQLL